MLESCIHQFSAQNPSSLPPNPFPPPGTKTQHQSHSTMARQRCTGQHYAAQRHSAAMGIQGGGKDMKGRAKQLSQGGQRTKCWALDTGFFNTSYARLISADKEPEISRSACRRACTHTHAHTHPHQHTRAHKAHDTNHSPRSVVGKGGRESVRRAHLRAVAKLVRVHQLLLAPERLLDGANGEVKSLGSVAPRAKGQREGQRRSGEGEATLEQTR
jgi:hypothetical protein